MTRLIPYELGPLSDYAPKQVIMPVAEQLYLPLQNTIRWAAGYWTLALPYRDTEAADLVDLCNNGDEAQYYHRWYGLPRVPVQRIMNYFEMLAIKLDLDWWNRRR